MALADTFVKNVKHSGSAVGDKITDVQPNSQWLLVCWSS